MYTYTFQMDITHAIDIHIHTVFAYIYVYMYTHMLMHLRIVGLLAKKTMAQFTQWLSWNDVFSCFLRATRKGLGITVLPHYHKFEKKWAPQSKRSQDPYASPDGCWSQMADGCLGRPHGEKQGVQQRTREGFDMGMDQYLLIPCLMGWTSIYQLFWCSPGVQGFDTLSFDIRIYPAILGIFWGCTDKIGKTHEQSYSGRGLASKSPVKWLWLNDLEIFWEYFHVFPECCVCLIHFPLLLVYMTTWACHDLSESRIPLNSMF